MSTSKLPRTGISARDRNLLLGFAFFAELVLLYMLLVDPQITRLQRAQKLENTVRRAHVELTSALPASTQDARAPLPESPLAPLGLGAHESASVVMQRYLGRMAGEEGVTLDYVTIKPAPELRGGLESYTLGLEAIGAYDAVTDFLGRLEAPDPVLGVEVFSVETAEADSDLIRATLTLRFYLRRA